MPDKIMPYSIEAEESLLGNIILFDSALREAVEADLKADDFYSEKNSSIYNIMLVMHENRESVDSTSLPSKLKDYGIYDKIGGMEYLTHLTLTTISAQHTKEYINIIKNKSLARKLIKVGEEISNEARDTSVDIDEMLDKAETKVTNVTRSKTNFDFVKGEELFPDTVKQIQEVAANKTSITGVRTLYNQLDAMTAGFQKGDLIILAARPSVGKTAFALNLAINAATVNHGAVAFFSLEMPAKQIATRILGTKSKVDISKLRTGRLNNEEWSRLNEASQELKSQNFYIDDSSTIKVSEIHSRARKLAQDHGLYMIIIDYIQLIQGSGNSESRQLEVSEISRKLKAMARDLNVPVIALSQLSRFSERREDKRPMLSDLRESGAIEQDADLVMFLYRDKKNEDDNAEAVDVELLLEKHRNGTTGKVDLRFEKSTTTFLPLSKIEEQ